MKGKLKPFEEVKNRIARQFLQSPGYFSVYHSTSHNHLTVRSNTIPRFGTIIDIELSRNCSEYRKIYKDRYGGHYYDEWFEWIGEEPPIIQPIPDDLWDISDW